MTRNPNKRRVAKRNASRKLAFTCVDLRVEKMIKINRTNAILFSPRLETEATQDVCLVGGELGYKLRLLEVKGSVLHDFSE